MPTLSPIETKELVQQVNKDLAPITDKFQSHMPLFDVAAVLTKHGLDPKPMENAVNSKDQGRLHVNVGQGVWLTLTWYKFETGRYEIVAYASSQHDDARIPAKPMDSGAKRKAMKAVNDKLVELGRTSQKSLGNAFKVAQDALEAAGFDATDFTHPTFGGQSTGRIHAPVGNGVFILFSWYRMEVTGNYEITAYVS